MTAIYSYIGFTGACREAMNFYKDCLGGDLVIQTIGESPMADKFPSEMKDKVLHSSLTKGSLLLMGSDMNGPEQYSKGNNIGLSLNCSSEEEINTFFSKLSEGGKVMDPLKDQFWGAVFGAVRDKYGIGWMLNYDKNQNK
jgi:PhnB protein